ncbi:hypothetical protein [Gracilibacillus sp. YIM 98692]|uniref:hypothetical protein n=1 Tax=Gracilibacillus sp. YIM 98692 TaxID=2663532 RepID=UPI0013D7F42C|nr:hypothetical protein [Gracilibacillus sp. YIM 98692]
MQIFTKRQKRSIKRTYRRITENKKRHEKDNRILLHHVDGDIDHQDDFWLLKAMDEKEVREILIHASLDGIENVPSMFDCTGQAFGDPAIIKLLCQGRYVVRRRLHFDV